MRILRVERDIPWLPLPNEISLCLDNFLPPVDLITSALALAFDEHKRILMANVNSRGWDIPGGHLEPGETPEEAMRREVLEETGASLGSVRLLGYQRIRLLGNVSDNYRYPHPDSYQVLFVGKVVMLRHIQNTAEARERALFSPEEALSLQWVQAHHDMYDAAMSNFTTGFNVCR